LIVEADASGPTQKALRDALVGRYAHDGLGPAQGDNPRIGDSPPGTGFGPEPKVIGCATDVDGEGTQIDAHRGLPRDDVVNTASFGSSPSKPFFGTIFVEPIM
jgi:hypothetical protein